MAKRRFTNQAEGRSPEQLSPEERRAARKADRLRGDRAKKPKGPRTGWRRATIPGVVVIAIVAIVLLLVYPSLTPPCFALEAIPSQSGVPLLPPSNTTDFSQTWCPNANHVLNVYPILTISINGQGVQLPPSIGRSANYTHYECDLPIVTHPASSGLPSGTIAIESPWPYVYSLGDFFSVWQDTYVSAFVNSTYSSRNIDYTPTQILGLSADSTHTLTLFVDNQPSSDGPSLNLDVLSGSASPTPSCMSKLYGTGHKIAIVYQTVHPGASVPGLRGPTPLTGASADLPTSFDAPTPKVIPIAYGPVDLAHFRGASLEWLVLRPA